MIKRLLLMLCGLVMSNGIAHADADGSLDDRIKLPPGFHIEVYARVPGARSMALDPQTGRVYVGSRRDKLHVITDDNRDGRAERVIELADNLNVPNGVAVLNNRLYVAENHRIAWHSLKGDPEEMADGWTTIKSDLPAKHHHGWRYLKKGPDNRLYVTIGAPYNIGMPQGLEGTILALDADGGNVQTIASGVRNSVGLDFHPLTGEMFFTDNGADNMGDNIPPDELNHVTQPGSHYGYPWFGGRHVRLTGFEKQQPPGPVVKPVVNFQAHTASLGVHFYQGRMFPPEYMFDAYVAQHGSWNRSDPVGYRIMRVRFGKLGAVLGRQVFASGWLKKGDVSGRPVDILGLPDGSMLVSDDHAGRVYRITWRGRKN